jgi:carboxyl-terminal processing protease
MFRRTAVVALIGCLFLLMSGGSAEAFDRTAEQKEPSDKQAVSDQQRRQQLEEERALLKLFADTLEQVRANYVDDSISERELIEAAIEGMLTKLDPYSNYIPPKKMELFKRSVEQQYGGVGIRVKQEGDQLVIVSPLYGSPAHRAGLKRGDRVVKIGEVSTKGLSLEQAVQQMKGKLGSSVELTIVHPESEQPETVTLRRELVHMETVMGYRRQANGQWEYICDPQRKIAYIRITTFHEGMSTQLTKVLQRLLGESIQGLILDLRYNPGGLLTEAVQTADLFLSDGLITSTEVRNTPRQTWSAEPSTTLIPDGFPLVVLVNRASASASEIVSACLQDHDVALVVGERTWGKASVQNIIELERGQSALKLTTGSYQRPSGENIDRAAGGPENEDWGVRPDEGHQIRLTDEQREALIARFRHMDILYGDGEAEVAESFEDPHVQDALQYLRKQLDDQQAAAADDSQPPQSAPPEAQDSAAASAPAGQQ